MNSNNLETEVWLLRGINYLHGILSKSGKYISFTAQDPGTLSETKLNGVEKKLGIKGLSKKLINGVPVVIFKEPVKKIEKLNFPTYLYLVGGVSFSINNEKYTFWFTKPERGYKSYTMDSINPIEVIQGFQESVGNLRKIPRARELVNRWKSALSDS